MTLRSPSTSPRFSLLVCLALSACTPTLGNGPAETGSSGSNGSRGSRPTTSAPSPLSLIEELKNSPATLILEVEKVRQLKAKAPIPILVDDDKAFVEALNAASDPTTPAEQLQRSGFFRTFNLAPEKDPDAPLDLGSSGSSTTPKGGMDPLVDEQLLAFYDTDSRQVHVRKSKVMSSSKTLVEQRGIIAHEVDHALQHQWFGSLRRENVDDDTALAFKAVVEGDAMVVLAGHVTQQRSLRRILARLSQASRDGMLSDRKDSPVLRKAPPTVRDRMMFPYENGFTFMSELYRSGGWQLVNRAFSKPPESTEQVLHPEKYLAGEHVVPVETPAIPSGMTKVATGRVGELIIRTFLAQCLAQDTAVLSARGWGGDAYSVVRDAKGTYALLWSTAWDDEAAAQSFASAIDGVSSCWARRARTGHQERPFVVTEGKRVVVLHGIAEPDRTSISKAMLAGVGEAPPPTPPFAGAKIIPIRPRPTYGAETVTKDGYVNPSVGLHAPVPPGYLYKAMENGGYILKPPSGQPGAVTIGVIDELVNDATYERLFAEFAKGLSKAVPNGRIETVLTQRIDLPVGPATTRMFRIAGTPVYTRIVLVPVCGGAAGIMISTHWVDKTSENRADDWLMKVVQDRFPNGRAPLCDEVDP